MFQEGKVVFVKYEEFIKVKKLYEDDLYAKYIIDFYDWDNKMEAFMYAYFIKDRRKIKEFSERTCETVCWIEPDEELSEEANGYVLKFYEIPICGRFGGEVVLRRITIPNAEEDALLYLRDNSGCKHVIPCNKNDKFCFMFYVHFYSTVLKFIKKLC